MTDRELEIIRQKLNLIELEMVLNCEMSIILKDMIDVLALYENIKNRKNRNGDR